MTKRKGYILILFCISFNLFAQDYTKLIYLKKQKKSTFHQSLAKRDIQKNKQFEGILQIVLRTKSSNPILFSDDSCKKLKEITPSVILIQCHTSLSVEKLKQKLKKENKNILDLREYKRYNLQTF